ncbi:MAG TPA: hypothetical protein PK335_08870 [Draconibacterium sp.]|nr:hypothetical protein [Draconibacterium sp.]
MKKSIPYIILSLIVLFAACGPSQEDKARVKLDQAKALLQNQDTTAALLKMDSIAKLYPEAAYSINAAENISKQVRFDVLQREESEIDSMKVQIAELEKNFETEKTEFDRYMQYIPKRQTFQRAWDRSYIQVHLDERGDLYISSNYYGDHWLNHYGIRVYDQGEDARTDSIPLGTVDNHHSDFMETKWEKVSYRNGKDNGVIEFIAQHVDRNLKAVFLGKEYYYIILETYDKEAVRDALALSKAIKKKSSLENEVKALQKRLNIQ